MRNDHITALLEENRFGALSLDDVSMIESHAADCSQCRKAYEASLIAGDLLKARVAETIEPSPFFKTRVMAALRERQREAEMPALARLWKAAGAIVSLMIVIVVILSALALFGSSPQPEIEAVDSPSSLNSLTAERVLFDDDSQVAGDNLTVSQVLETIFASEDADGSY
ncbi:MAG TPA: hypothetical protein VNN73_05610 [Blastocatellia bacterium]|nr:hypothetical protein [Blastocatellia bacterium]